MIIIPEWMWKERRTEGPEEESEEMLWTRWKRREVHNIHVAEITMFTYRTALLVHIFIVCITRESADHPCT